jgi:hypothetical protein
VAFALYWVWLLGLWRLIGQIEAGNAVAIGWAALSFFGLCWLWLGISEALSHNDGLDERSAGWSFWLAGLCGWALWHGWFLDGNAWAFHLSRAFWLSLMASELFNLWLNFRGIFRRRAPVPVVQPNPFLINHGPRVIRGYVEVIEGQGVENLARHLGSNTRPLPRVIGSDGQPVQIVYVQDEQTGEFIPLQVPNNDRVPRRLR